MMKTETVWTPVKADRKVHISQSRIWNEAYRPEEMSEEIRKRYPVWYKYTVKFNGLTPVQVADFKIFKNE